ncbi:MAG: hypothetical protein K2Y05_08485 [Hyphomicrobiaceae bacterium]|nr:hypothetical protein [Hyphomicrobiaceae bacterium]
MPNVDLSLIGFAATVFTLATLGYATVATLFQVRARGANAARARGVNSAPVSTNHTSFQSGNARIADVMRAGRVSPPAPIGMLSASSQIERLSGYVGEQLERVSDAEQLHRRAGQQLDLASYSIQMLSRELGTIVPSLKPVPLALEAEAAPLRGGLSLAA